MTKRQPKFDDVLGGVRVRVFATRNEYEVIFADDDVNDPTARVLVYPKIGSVDMWAHQARAEYKEKTE